MSAVKLFKKYKDINLTPALSPNQLTGREIQLIYDAEMERAYYPEGLE